jgi:hypothetical protein
MMITDRMAISPIYFYNVLIKNFIRNAVAF